MHVIAEMCEIHVPKCFLLLKSQQIDICFY